MRKWLPLLLPLALFLLDGESFILVVWAAALCHEGGHLAALELLRCPVGRVRWGWTGPRIDYRPGALSYKGDAVLALAGPAMNVAAAALGVLAARVWPAPPLFRFIGASLLLAGFNLLPALPLDGGRAALALLCLRLPPDGAERLVRGFGLLAGLALAAAGAALLRRGGNCSLLLAGGLLFAENALQKPPKTVR